MLCFYPSVCKAAAAAKGGGFSRGGIIHAVDQQHVAAQFGGLVGVLLAFVVCAGPFFSGIIDVQRPEGQLLPLLKARRGGIPQVAAEGDEAFFAANSNCSF